MLANDPLTALVLAIAALILCSVLCACYLLTRAIEHFDRQTPKHRRALERAYARFHGFLLIVRLAALRRTE